MFLSFHSEVIEVRMVIGTLDQRYSGTLAAAYDTRRERSPRWQAEVAAFSQYMSLVKPRSVLDCPFGTGRWIEWYRSLPGPVIGIDKSADMLAVAKSKGGDSWPSNMECKIASIFEHDFSLYRTAGIDLLVCVRFLNWFPRKLARQALSRLAQAEIPHAIVGASVFPRHLSQFTRLRMRGRNYLENLRLRSQQESAQHVHDEQLVQHWFAELGWRVERQTPIFQSPTRHNFFYLLRRRT